MNYGGQPLYPRMIEWMERLEHWANSLPRVKAALLIGLFSICLNFAFSVGIGRPQPRVHDEFSNLLAADTFSHGRLTNPAHPMWRHFESMHIIQQPSYASKYPPGHGLMLALGQKMGDPLIGLWLEGALAAMAVYYLLTACFSPGWALLGGMLCVFHPLFINWNQTFWGGSFQAMGGALTLGAVVRAIREPSWKVGCVMGGGISILALSRPFEGGIFTLLCSVFMLVAYLRQGFGKMLASVGRIVPGCLLILSLTGVWHAFYNQRVTGNPFVMPYMIYEQTYGACPLFLWQKLQSLPDYGHQTLKEFADWVRNCFLVQQTGEGFFKMLGKKALSNLPISTWNGLLILPLVLALIASRNHRALKAGFLLLFLFVLVELMVVWMFPHYLAAAYGLLLCLSVYGLQELRRLMAGNGIVVLHLYILLCVAMGIARTLGPSKNGTRVKRWQKARSAVLMQLRQTPRNDLILVSYVPGHSPHQEWVYNDADIDQSPVIFARSMADNSEILKYFKDRVVWQLNVLKKGYELNRISGVAPSEGQ